MEYKEKCFFLMKIVKNDFAKAFEVIEPVSQVSEVQNTEKSQRERNKIRISHLIEWGIYQKYLFFHLKLFT